MRNLARWIRPVAASGVLWAIGVVAGCGGDGTGRIEVSGQATYLGQPIPLGSIAFEPDHPRGGTGPGAVIEIKEGRYRATSGKGPTLGPHRVRIVGYDGKPGTIDGTPGGMFLPEGQALFAPYETTVDLAADTLQHDFDVPGTGAKAAH